MPPLPPRLSLVLLTWNEEANIAACLASLARQTVTAFEVILVDAGSADRTVALVEEALHRLPFALRLRVGPPRMPIGEARNLGVGLAQAPVVAFLSADAEPEPDWVERALAAFASADMVFGLQRHAPHRWTLGAAVRGLRYRFPEGPTDDPLRFASNVAAAYRRDVLVAFPFDAWANAAEDLLLARRAAAAGHRVAYDPGMVVRHHDVGTVRQEMRKNLREGRGCGLYVRELGVQWPVLAWLALLALALLSMVLSVAVGLAALATVLWLPAVRRGVRRRSAMPAGPLLAGVAASPLFDLAFLAQYLRGLAGAGLAARLRRREPHAG